MVSAGKEGTWLVRIDTSAESSPTTAYSLILPAPVSVWLNPVLTSVSVAELPVATSAADTDTASPGETVVQRVVSTWLMPMTAVYTAGPRARSHVARTDALPLVEPVLPFTRTPNPTSDLFEQVTEGTTNRSDAVWGGCDWGVPLRTS